MTAKNSSAEWGAQLRWRSLHYNDHTGNVAFLVEPMVDGPDRVLLTNSDRWQLEAPAGMRKQRDRIIGRLQKIAWNRQLRWETGEYPCRLVLPLSGSLESTRGGTQLEALQLFNPGSPYSANEVKEAWLAATRKFAEQARGLVTVYQGARIPGSVFEEIERPILEANPNVTLRFE